MSFIDRYKDAVTTLCAEHLVDRLYIFGSAVNNQLTEKSDVDLVVRFKKRSDLANYFKNYMSLKNKLKDLFNREIDLLEEQAISNPYVKQSIDNSKQLIYG
jgi:predicted nucleotidyltransferase